MPVNSHTKKTLFFLVKQSLDKTQVELCTGPLQADLNSKLPCLTLVEDEKYFNRSCFEEKIYQFPEDKKALKEAFAGINFRPSRELSDSERSSVYTMLNIFKPEIQADRLKRKQAQALSETVDVKSVSASAVAPGERREEDASESMHGSGDSKSTNSSPRSGSSQY